jgi:glycosyltransferase involved in cell wall biosynthesis
MKTVTGKAKVTAIIPCYNRERYVAQAVESVLT